MPMTNPSKQQTWLKEPVSKFSKLKKIKSFKSTYPWVIVIGLIKKVVDEKE
jgi:hypothetical protein